MRDALRAVGLVLGVAALLAGGAGLFRGRLTKSETMAVGFGLVMLAVVAVVPPGKPRRPLYEDWDEGPKKG